MQPGQVVKIIGGTYKGKAGEIRLINAEKGKATIRIGGMIHIIYAENLEPKHG